MALVVNPPTAGTLHSIESPPAPAVMDAADGSTVIALYGEADAAVRRTLSATLTEVIATGRGDVVIDLSETTFIDSAVVRALADGHTRLADRGNKLTFRSPSRLATRVLDVFGLGELIETDGTVPPQPAAPR